MSHKLVPLGSVVDYIRGITFKPTDVVEPTVENAVVCMRTKNIQKDLDESDLIAVDQAFVKRDEQYLREGDLLISSANSWELVGKTVYVPDLPYAATAGGFISIIRARAGKVDSRYLFHWIMSGRTQDLIRNCGRKTTNISNLSSQLFLKLEIPLPRLEEQKRITAILDKADSLRRKRAQAIALADDFLRATFLEMFGDPVTNYKKWPEREIYEIAKVTTGNTPSRETPDNFGSAIEWIKSDNINTPSHWLTKATEGLSEQGLSIGRTVPAGSILMTCIAGSPSCIGNVAMADRQVAFNQQINALTPFAGTEPEFLYGLLLYSKQRVQAASTNSMKGMVSKGGLERVRLIWPSADLQSQYARAFKKIAALREKQFKSDLSPLFSSLQDTLLS